MNLCKSFNSGLRKNMCTDASPSGGMDSSNPRHWRDGRLCHHGDGVWKVICAFCAVSQLVTCQSGSPYVKNVPQHNLKMRLKVLLKVPHWRAPHHSMIHAKVKWYADICSKIHGMQMEPHFILEHIRLLTKCESAHHQQRTAMAMCLPDGFHKPKPQKTCPCLPRTSTKSSTIIALLIPGYLSTSHNNNTMGTQGSNQLGRI
jgi:hypothetical protein